jgi:hypothetical protein
MIKPLVGLEGRPELHRRLNASQYAVFVLFGVDDDYSDGGMYEVYYNSTGAIAGEAVDLLREVGAPLHAQALALTNPTHLADGAGAVQPGCTQTGAWPSGTSAYSRNGRILDECRSARRAARVDRRGVHPLASQRLFLLSAERPATVGPSFAAAM